LRIKGPTNFCRFKNALKATPPPPHIEIYHFLAPEPFKGKKLFEVTKSLLRCFITVLDKRPKSMKKDLCYHQHVTTPKIK
jgi:hypothetical protein